MWAVKGVVDSQVMVPPFGRCVTVELVLQGRRAHRRGYLNSGTFRTTLTQTFDRQDFVRFQRMSLVIIHEPCEFSPDEDAPTYEMWSGLRMRH